MLDMVEAIAGWAITWLIIIAFPSLGAALADFLFPKVPQARRILVVTGILVAIVVLSFMPEPPAGTTGWVAEYRFYFQTYYNTYDGITKALTTLLGIYAFFAKARGRLKRTDAAAEPSGS